MARAFQGPIRKVWVKQSGTTFIRRPCVLFLNAGLFVLVLPLIVGHKGVSLSSGNYVRVTKQHDDALQESKKGKIQCQSQIF